MALAVTSMIALSFLIPLAMLVQSEARSRAATAAEQRAAALAPVLTLTTSPDQVAQAAASVDGSDRLSVHLPGGALVGTARVSPKVWRQAAAGHRAFTTDTDAGPVYLQAVVLPEGRTAVIESFIPRAERDRGVTASWTVLGALAVALVAGSLLVADRLGTRVVAASRELSRAALTLGEGRLEVRVRPAGPPELAEVGTAFNAMADQMTGLIAMERELIADLSHRLRTPLTALHLVSDRLTATHGEQLATGLDAAITSLEAELDAIITAARTPLALSAIGPAAADVPACEAAQVIAARAEFWSVLASNQERPCGLSITSEATPVALPAEELAAVADALIGNVFRHTPGGTPFEIGVHRTAHTVVFLIDDGGPGISDPEDALTRGQSAEGSTGLGLDIARRAASVCSGSMSIETSPLGGTRIRVEFGLATRRTDKRRSSRGPRRGRRQRTGVFRSS
ncbi:HAMP domain-containing sensor histidine kinase [Streptomyces sp. NPDC004082]|uniref:HAMP domain-containing sensor histidine kinase n=1 Tax=Streptomyces sp. NPDC005481 TaxID=3154881 RepID=UPI0033B4CC48